MSSWLKLFYNNVLVAHTHSCIRTPPGQSNSDLCFMFVELSLQKSSTARCVPNKRYLVAHRRPFHQKKNELFQLLIGLKEVKFDVKSEGVLLTDTSVTCLAVSCWHWAFSRARRSGFSTANRWLVVLVSFSAAWSKEKKNGAKSQFVFPGKIEPTFQIRNFQSLSVYSIITIFCFLYDLLSLSIL